MRGGDNAAPMDGTAYMISFNEIQSVVRAGAELRERINLTAKRVSKVRAQLIKKDGKIRKENGEIKCTAEQKVIEGIIELIDGKPCANGVCDRNGLRHKFRLSMDDPEQAKYQQQDIGDIEVILDDIDRDLDDIICQKNLSSMDIMGMISMNKSTEQRLKE